MFINFFQKNTEKAFARFTSTLILLATFGLYFSNTQAADVSCTWASRNFFGTNNWTDSSWNSDPGCIGTFPNNNGKTFDATVSRTGFSGINLDQNIAIQTFNFNGGTLTGTNTLTVNETFNWTRGALVGTGIVNAKGGLNISGSLKDIRKGWTLVNNQEAIWTSGAIRILDDSQLVNQSDATFNVTGNNLRMSGSSQAQFLNNGTLVVKLNDATQNVQFDSPSFNNNAIVKVEAGIARFGGGGISAGSFEVAANAQLQFSGGTHFLLPTSSVTGSNVEFSFKDSGGRTTIGGTYNVANTKISGNTAVFNTAASTTGTLTQTGGFLDGTGDVIVLGKTTLSGGVIQSTRPDTQPQAVLAAVGGLDINGSFQTIVGNRRILNLGVANWNSGGIRLNNTLTRLENAEGATFNINENATFIVGQGLPIGGDPTQPLEKGLFVNRGDVVVNRNDDAPPVQINTPFANLGRVHVQGDNLTFGDNLLQFAPGSLLFDIAAPDVFDVLHIAGSAALDGIIDISLVDILGAGNTFIPAVGDTFDILTASSILPFTPGGPGFALGGPDGDKFNATIVSLATGEQAIRLSFLAPIAADIAAAVVPIPATIWLFMSALGILGIGFRKKSQ